MPITWPIATLLIFLAVLASGLLVRAFGTAVVTFLSGLLYGVGGILLWIAVGVRAVFGRAPGFLAAAGRGLGRAGAAIGRAGLVIGRPAYRWIRRLVGIICWLVVIWILAIATGIGFGNWWAVAFFTLLPLMPVLLWKLGKITWWVVRHPVYALLLLTLGGVGWLTWRKIQASGLASATNARVDAKLNLTARQQRLQEARLKGEGNATDHKRLLQQPNILMQTAKVGEPTGFWGDNNAPQPWKGSPMIPVGTPVAHIPEAQGRWIGRDWMVKVCLPGPLGDFGACPEGWIADRRLDYQKPVPDTRPTLAAPALAARRDVLAGQIAVPPGVEPFVALVDKHLQSSPTVPRNLVLAMIDVESNWNPRAVSPKGAQGLMQLMPDTAKLLGVSDPFDPDQNIGGGIRYLAEQLANFSSTELALAAYNWGPEHIRTRPGKSWADIAPEAPTETQDYVRKVIALARGGQRPPAVQVAAAQTFLAAVGSCRDDISVHRLVAGKPHPAPEMSSRTGYNRGFRARMGSDYVVLRRQDGAELKRVLNARPEQDGELWVRIDCPGPGTS